MRKIVFIIVFISNSIFAQEPIIKELGPFNELKVFSGISVQLKKATTPSIEITGKKKEEVDVKNVNGRLKISMRFPETLRGGEASIVLYYADDLFLIDANEGSVIRGENAIVQQSIELRVQEGAYINTPIETKYVIVKAVTGGQIQISGSAESQDIELSTGGVYKGYELKSNQTYISSSSGAVGEIFVFEMLDVKVNLGGTVYYKGNPTDVIRKKIIGGTIKSKD